MVRYAVEGQILAVAAAVALDGGKDDEGPEAVEGGSDEGGDEDCLKNVSGRGEGDR